MDYSVKFLGVKMRTNVGYYILGLAFMIAKFKMTEIKMLISGCLRVNLEIFRRKTNLNRSL